MRSAENSLTEETLTDTLIAPSRPSPICASRLSALAKRRAAASALLRGSTTGAAVSGRYCKKKIAASGAGPSPTVLGRAAVGIWSVRRVERVFGQGIWPWWYVLQTKRVWVGVDFASLQVQRP
jgi:hypothetical protein